MILTKMSGFE